jgi:electron transfer flavoprotein alpha subunit
VNTKVNIESWIIATDTARLGGILNAARQLGGHVTAAVIGSRSLADAVAAAGPDQLRWYACRDGAPAEAYASQVAEAVQKAAARVVLSSTAPAARVVLGAAAAKLGAAVISSVQALAVEGDKVKVSRAAAQGKAVEILDATGAVACIFDGEDVAPAASHPATVEEVLATDPGDSLRVVETIPDTGGSAGLRTAARVVSAGLGIRAKGDLTLIEDLAAALGAEIACTLPVCDDMRWYGPERVVGRSHNQIAPDLYIAVGISGQPQHAVGVRDAKVVVVINNDPKATFFKICDYGIIGDLYKVVPALTAAFRQVPRQAQNSTNQAKEQHALST